MKKSVGSYFCECGKCLKRVKASEHDMELFNQYRFDANGRSLADKRDLVVKSCPNLHHYDMNKLLAEGEEFYIFDQTRTILQHTMLEEDHCRIESILEEKLAAIKREKANPTTSADMIDWLSGCESGIKFSLNAIRNNLMDQGK